MCSSVQSTALHVAALNGHTAACQLLISAEADVNAKNKCAFMTLKDRCAFMLKICC